MSEPRSVVSLASGNQLGQILDAFIDPINGVLLGVTVGLADGSVGGLAHDEIYSFGRDAVMARSDLSIIFPDSDLTASGQPAGKLIGTKIITESGDLIGQIADIFVTLKPPPRILYEARQSILDKFLGREFFVPAAVGHALSDDATRLVVPDITTELATSDLESLIGQDFEVRSFDPVRPDVATPFRDDDTILIDEDETVVRFGDDDDTVVRTPRKSNA